MRDFFKNSDADMEFVIDGKAVTVISTKKANELLRERGEVVYRKSIALCAESWTRGEHDCPDKTHTGVLICIEPIEEPDSLKKFAADLSEVIHEYFPYSKAVPLLERLKKLGEKK